MLVASSTCSSLASALSRGVPLLQQAISVVASSSCSQQPCRWDAQDTTLQLSVLDAESSSQGELGCLPVAPAPTSTSQHTITPPQNVCDKPSGRRAAHQCSTSGSLDWSSSSSHQLLGAGLQAPMLQQSQTNVCQWGLQAACIAAGGMPGMRRALHGWARASLSKDQVIRGLQDMKAVQDFWKKEGGTSLQEAAAGSSSVPRPVPCRLTYLNLSTLLHHILLLAKAAPVQQQQEQQEPGQAQGGQEGNEPSEAEEEQQLAALLGDICERLERRCHMCDPTTAGRILVNLGHLGYTPPPTLTLLLLDRARWRISEAAPEDILRICKGLALIKHQGVPDWWAAAGAALQARGSSGDVERLHKLAGRLKVQIPEVSMPPTGAAPAAAVSSSQGGKSSKEGSKGCKKAAVAQAG